jgi:hypothetical protein
MLAGAILGLSVRTNNFVEGRGIFRKYYPIPILELNYVNVNPCTMQIKLCELLYYADSSKSTFLLHRFPCVNYVLNRFRCVNRSILQIPLS